MINAIYEGVWVMVSKDGPPDFGHMGFEKNEAIERFCREFGGGWPFWEGKGYECVKANITIEIVELIPIDNIL